MTLKCGHPTSSREFPRKEDGEKQEDSKFPGCQIKMEEKRGGGQVRDEKASEGSFLLIFGFLFPLPFVDVVVTHPALHSLPPAFGFMGFISPACLLAHPLFSSGVTRLENIDWKCSSVLYVKIITGVENIQLGGTRS